MDLGTMIARIRTDLNRGTDYDERIRHAIADAIVHYQGERFAFNTRRAVAELSAGQETVSLPTGWLEVDYLRLERDGEWREPLTEVSYYEIEDEHRSSKDIGAPRIYAIQHRELRLYPVPDRTYSLVMSFLVTLPEVSHSASDEATNAWMTEGEQLIRLHAMRDLLVIYDGAPESIARGAALTPLIDAQLEKLKRQAGREQTAGRLRPFI